MAFSNFLIGGKITEKSTQNGLKIEGRSGHNTSISTSYKPLSWSWDGGCVKVYLSNGETRLYSDYDEYTNA